MKNIVLAILFGLIILPASAQLNDLEVIASAGTSQQVGNLQLDWTLGEPVILTLENSPVLLSQGFHQPDYYLISATENQLPIENWNVFPNPCKTELNVSIQFPVITSGYMEFFNVAGKYIGKESFSGISLDKHFDISTLAPGKYHLVLHVPNYKNQSVAFIKL